MKFLSILTLLLFSTIALSQQVLRNETRIKSWHESDPKVFLLPDQRVVVQTMIKVKSVKTTILRIFGIDLNLIKEFEFSAIAKANAYPDVTIDKFRITVFYYAPQTGNYKFITIDLETFKEQSFEGVLKLNFRWCSFSQIGNRYFVHGYFEKKYYVFEFDSIADSPSLYDLSSIFPAETERVASKIIQSSYGDELMFYDLNSKNIPYNFNMVLFDSKSIGMENLITFPRRYQENILNDFSISKTNKNEYILTGSYNSINSVYPIGLYFYKLVDKQTSIIKLYKFLELKNFTSFFSEYQQYRIEKKKEKQESNGSEYEFQCNVSPLDASLQNGKYLLGGEFYFVKYSSSTDQNGRTHLNCSGYQYTHASIAILDSLGILTWSNSVKMNVLKKCYNTTTAATDLKDNTIRFVYLVADDYLVWTTIDQNETVNKSSYDLKNSLKPNLKHLYTGYSNMKPLSADSYLVYGVQKIKVMQRDKMDKGKKQRHVLFLTKVTL
jgi:hypothetical protein